jgi:hypothetical protein
VVATRPQGFELPPLAELDAEVRKAIGDAQDSMTHTTVTFDDELKKAKSPGGDDPDADETDDAADEE